MISTILLIFSTFWTLLSLALGLFALWKKMRLERITSEDVLLDKVLISVVGGALFTRVLLFVLSQPIFSRFIAVASNVSLTTTVETLVVIVSLFLLVRLTHEEW